MTTKKNDSKPEIQGVVVKDTTGWKEDFIKDMQDNEYGMIWWNKNCAQSDDVYSRLKSKINNNGTFDYLIVENDTVKYKATVVEFCERERYDEVKGRWEKKKPVSFQYNIDNYQIISGKVEIVFLVTSLEKVDINMKNINFLDNSEELINNNIVPYCNIYNKNELIMKKTLKILEHKKQIILQGAPGTGKTYNTAELAVSICNPNFTKGKNRDEIMDEYKRLCKEGQISFTTFHQSMDYEEFVEGLMPSNDSNNNGFEVKSGIFKNICTEALDKENSKKNYVLIIDEINRGNISKILGELITLLEADKRVGETNELTATLPYSQTKFGVPSNLYIIGTMNTADRSVGCIDYAIRRRFAFMTVKSDFAAIEDCFTKDELRESAKALYDKVASIIKENINSEFNFEDLMIGHSYFIAKTIEELEMKLDYEIKPLLMEYMNDGIINATKDEISKLSVGSVTESEETSDSNNG